MNDTDIADIMDASMDHPPGEPPCDYFDQGADHEQNQPSSEPEKADRAPSQEPSLPGSHPTNYVDTRALGDLWQVSQMPAHPRPEYEKPPAYIQHGGRL
eukprot:8932372-Pyramimonas_sp.AAC.1